MAALQAAVKRNWRAAVATLAILADTCVISATFLLAALLDSRTSFQQALAERWGLLAASIVVFLILSTSHGIYRTLAYSSFRRQAFGAGKAYAYTIALILSSLFLLQRLDYSRVFLFLFFLLFPFVYIVCWSLLRTWMRGLHVAGYGRWNTLAIGSQPYLDQLLRRLHRNPALGYDVINVITTPNTEGEDGMMHVERSTVEHIVREKNIGLIAFSSDQLNGSFDQLEGLCRSRRVQMRVISAEAEGLFAKIGLHDISGISLFTPERKRIERAKAITKRVFDILGASVCLLLLTPIFLVVALASKIESRGPVFYKQKRSLTDQDPAFNFYKFRSMVLEADELKDTLMPRNESTGPLFKMRDDPRLTRVGKIIRRYSIDELPQLFNVLKGEMSLVGPRPLPARDFTRLEEEDHMGGYFRQRALAKPGMSGLWQISGRSEIGFREMVLLDLYYIEHQTILFDIEILMQTIPVVLFGKGAY